MSSRWLALAFLLVACSSEDSGTTGKRIILKNAATGDPSARAPFTTGFGWDVTLSKAAVATSGLYYFDGPPPTALYHQPKRGLGERFAGFFIGTAWAHPGHYQSGTALGQLLLAQPVAIDLLAPAPTALPEGEGVTGTYRSARFVIPQSAPADPNLGGHIAVAEGRALKTGDAAATPIFFRLVADYADVSASITNGAVDGCVLEEAMVTDSGSVTVAVKPVVWLNLVDFSKIAPGTEAAPTEARDPGFSQGVTQLSAYRFTYARP